MFLNRSQKDHLNKTFVINQAIIFFDKNVFYVFTINVRVMSYEGVWIISADSLWGMS